MSGSGQVVPVNHCEPGPVFLTLESAPTHRERVQGQVKVRPQFGFVPG